MNKRKTAASVRIRQELKRLKISGRELARKSVISYYDMDNILAGKSSKVDKLVLISKTINRPLLYLLGADLLPYDGNLHGQVIRAITEVYQERNLELTKYKADELFEFIYPRLQRVGDADELALIQAKSIVVYLLTKEQKAQEGVIQKLKNQGQDQEAEEEATSYQEQQALLAAENQVNLS